MLLEKMMHVSLTVGVRPYKKMDEVKNITAVVQPQGCMYLYKFMLTVRTSAHTRARTRGHTRTRTWNAPYTSYRGVEVQVAVCEACLLL